MRFLDRLLQRWRGAVAARWVPTGAKVLDVGCHNGEFFDQLGPRLGFGVGFDPLAPPASGSNGRWVLVQDRFPSPDAHAPASFDVVVLLATLEHVLSKAELVRACDRVLRPGGRVVITVPSRWVDPLVGLLVRLRLLDGMSLDEHHGFDPTETHELFLRSGFRLRRWCTFQLGLNHLFVFDKPEKPACGDGDVRPQLVSRPQTVAWNPTDR